MEDQNTAPEFRKMTLSISFDNSRDLTIFTVQGELTLREQIDALQQFYSGTPSANVVWDFRMVTGDRISSEELREIITFIKAHENKRPTGKTALVSRTDLDFGLSRMSQAFGDAENLPWEIQGFRSITEAIKWIDE